MFFKEPFYVSNTTEILTEEMIWCLGFASEWSSLGREYRWNKIGHEIIAEAGDEHV